MQLDNTGTYITIFYTTDTIPHVINVEKSYLTTLVHTHNKLVFCTCVFPFAHFLKHVNFLDITSNTNTLNTSNYNHCS